MKYFIQVKFKEIQITPKSFLFEFPQKSIS